MATYINNIFNFGRRLPSPFDTIANKKIKVSSKYGDGTTSTLCSAMIKAIHAVCHCMDGSGEGAEFYPRIYIRRYEDQGSKNW